MAEPYHSQYDEPKIFDDNLAKSLISQQEFADIKNSFIQGIQFFNKAIAEKYEGDDEEILRWITQVQALSDAARPCRLLRKSAAS